MELFKNIKNVYFLGIGGIGMSALARYFKINGYAVAGYDRTPSPLTKKLIEEGIPVNYTDFETSIDSRYLDLDTTLVVYTPAVPKDNQQMNVFIRKGFRLYKRAEVLGMLSRNGKALCIAGTHGKTTITTMLAYLLKNSSLGCNAFLGGISVNFGTNLLLDRNSEYIVIEADEFDRSFLHLEPEIALITAMDADHLDIYGDESALKDAFEQFAEQVRPGGKLFIKKDLKLQKRSVDGYYAVNEETDCYSDNLRLANGRYTFDYHGKYGEIKDILLGFPGMVNVENATAAITVALEAGVTPDEIRKSLPDFRGIVRRFNICAEGDVTYIDDYAHHPREIEAILKSVRNMWPEKKLTVTFQPHLFSRTNDFHREFADALNMADEVLLLEIYPAREQPMPGVTSEIIQKDLKVPSRILSKEELPEYVKLHVNEGIFMTLGAGDIDRFVPVFTEMFK
ncbi:UDP-N-acetylmuramate--L-alanine ligase [Porphyromonadaceae bacterium OttesenSCG-928-L07]|nr:UDP-N-acetylmuramate--L-alanine ligase [Porphyromonadaceae bacterium OttesenSCG-928-L07]MDL2251714.1 UDP-N-acetylmuramate--L-alanine ligase [Odoribacter sp. OttesenSCG-928-J03]MDL2283458.1 UDP-N-acetylmuramate--L-alanine ligase [Odoribacter sp. OttesenSCG-928-G04]MDL2330992.1 UDP-N-acetylmuramate--L-alanine ligase [Odoribacter sp. OttesenSCG-928-A06]